MCQFVGALQHHLKDSAAEVVVGCRSAPSLLLPSRPVADRKQFSRFHSVEAHPCLKRELTEGGWDESDVTVALQLSQNNFVQASG